MKRLSREDTQKSIRLQVFRGDPTEAEIRVFMHIYLLIILIDLFIKVSNPMIDANPYVRIRHRSIHLSNNISTIRCNHMTTEQSNTKHPIKTVPKITVGKIRF